MYQPVCFDADVRSEFNDQAAVACGLDLPVSASGRFDFFGLGHGQAGLSCIAYSILLSDRIVCFSQECLLAEITDRSVECAGVARNTCCQVASMSAIYEVFKHAMAPNTTSANRRRAAYFLKM
jgi:hypothetical protein